MMIFELLSKAEQRIIQEWHATQPPGTEPLLMLRTEASFFIWRTGQVYRFEDYLKRPEAGRAAGTWSGEQGRQVMRVRDILVRIRDAQQLAAHRELVQVGIDELDFLAAQGQQQEFYGYLETYYAHPPPVAAHFGTREEAEDWLIRMAEPPSSAYVLVGGEYFKLHYRREQNVRVLKRDHALERFIEAVTSRGLPSAVATFASRAEAEAWWMQHPDPPISAWVRAAGEHYLAINHGKIAHRTLHPLSILREWEEEKKRHDEVAKAQPAEDTLDRED